METVKTTVLVMESNASFGEQGKLGKATETIYFVTASLSIFFLTIETLITIFGQLYIADPQCYPIP